MTAPPTFSVIVTDYEPSIPREFFLRKMRCLAEQTCDDFEVIVYHDGPKSVPYAAEVAGTPLHPRTRFVVTDARANDWGHSNRDRGMREAAGEWILHTNADNVYYPRLVERLKAALTDGVPCFRRTLGNQPRLFRNLAKRLDRNFGTSLLQSKLIEVPEPQILIFAILMRGMFPLENGALRVRSREETALVFGGVPVQQGFIDAMQFVMRRDLWLAEGGWHDRSERSDGMMYEAFAARYAIRAIPEILGEHW